MTLADNKVILTEKSTPLTYIKESGERDNGKHYLGKLAGVGADFTKPTRNGRRYPYELWVNVQNSSDFKEGMDTLTIFGECDHPETRVDTSIKEIAIVLTKFDIRKDEGIVYTEFDILDTPSGRILKELLDYGSQIGVSSRGLGDEVIKDGETIIDPDTYVFYGFDAVVMPAVVSARPTVIESKVKTLSESVRSEIVKASTVHELNSIKRIVEATKMPELDSIVESIDIKLSESGENISSKLESDLGKLAKECDELKDHNFELESKLSAKDIRLDEMKKIMHESIRNSNKLSKMLQKSKIELLNIRNELDNSKGKFDSLVKIKESDSKRMNIILSDAMNSNRKYKGSVSELSTELESLKLENSKLMDENKSLKSDISSLNEKLEDSTRTINSNSKKIKSYESKISDIENKLESRKLTEQKAVSASASISKRLDETSKKLARTISEYINVKCAQCGIDPDTVKNLLPNNYNTEDIDRIVEQLSDRKDRLNKLPIARVPRTAILSESIGNLSDEDRQTINILNKTIK